MSETSNEINPNEEEDLEKDQGLPPEIEEDKEEIPKPEDDRKETFISDKFMELPLADRQAIYELAQSMFSNRNKPDSVIYQILRKTSSLLIKNNLV